MDRLLSVHLCTVATIDEQILAIDEGGFVARHEANCRCKLFRPTRAMQHVGHETIRIKFFPYRPENQYDWELPSSRECHTLHIVMR